MSESEYKREIENEAESESQIMRPSNKVIKSEAIKAFHSKFFIQATDDSIFFRW